MSGGKPYPREREKEREVQSKKKKTNNNNTKTTTTTTQEKKRKKTSEASRAIHNFLDQEISGFAFKHVDKFPLSMNSVRIHIFGCWREAFWGRGERGKEGVRM